MITIGEFTEKVNRTQYADIIELRKTLKGRLQVLRIDLLKTLDEQDLRVDGMITKLMADCSLMRYPIVQNYRDIEERSGREIRRMLPIPIEVSTTISNTLSEIDISSSRLLECLRRLVLEGYPTSSPPPSTKGDVIYCGQVAPTRELLLNTNFSNMTTLVLDNAGVRVACNFFRNFASDTLKVLSLSTYIVYAESNNLDDSDIRYVCAARIPNLIEFKGCENRISDAGADYISRAEWPRLGYFNLYNNQIRSEGAKKLLTRFSSQLFRFDLDYNLIGDEICEEVERLNWL